MKKNVIQYIETDQLIPYDNNPRINDGAVYSVAESIKEFGFLNPIIIDKNNVIAAGHTRLKAAKLLDIESVPCIRAEDLTEDQINAYRVIDNKTQEFSDWDAEKLDIEMDKIELDLSMWFGYDSDPSVFDYDESDDQDEPDEIEEIEGATGAAGKYGVPYRGNKSRIADKIINFLPEGKRFVDLFGGGGAMTHCAALSGKYEKILYNDINPLITELFLDAVNGKIKPRIITREEFEHEKGYDGYAKYIWSFGNNGEDYLWGRDVEPVRLKACNMILAETWQERRRLYRELIAMLKKKGVGHAENLQSLEASGRLQALERIEASNIDYRDYKHTPGDVVYCDIPYESNEKYYGIKFDNKAFYEWARTRDYQVYFSGYEISEDFYRVKVADIKQIYGATTNARATTEYLYSNMEM